MTHHFDWSGHSCVFADHPDDLNCTSGLGHTVKLTVNLSIQPEHSALSYRNGDERGSSPAPSVATLGANSSGTQVAYALSTWMNSSNMYSMKLHTKAISVSVLRSAGVKRFANSQSLWSSIRGSNPHGVD